MGFTSQTIITNAGLTLLGNTHQGKAFEISRAVFGEGELNGQNPAALTAVIAPVMEARIASVSRTVGGRVTIRLDTVKAEDIPRDFWWREFAVYAKDPVTDAETLYIYNNAGEYADYIQTGGAGMKSLTVTIPIGNAPNVVCELDESVMYVRIDEFDNFLASPELNGLSLTGDIDMNGHYIDNALFR